MPPLRPRVPFSRHLWRNVGCVAALAVAFVLYALSERDISRAYQQRYRSYLLADELRQSGDDLTRMARTYVVTGDPVYKQRFQDILDIRNGTKARPEAYARPYWDLVLGDRPAPRPDGHAVPLLALMRQAGFTDAEFRKLAEAKANSDGLTIPEFEAMKLVESTGPDAEANRARGRAIMYDKKYHEAKVSVMKPIDDFFVLVDERTDAAVRAAETRTAMFRWMAALIGLVLIASLWRSYVVLGDTLGAPVEVVHGQIARIGAGDFSAAIPVSAGLEDSVLGWLSQTQSKLRETDRGRKEAEGELRRLNAELEERVHSRTLELEAANGELEAFSYAVAHDLRAPLRGMNGFAQVLLDDHADKLDADGLDCVQEIHASARQMAALIDALLSLSRVVRGEMRRQPVDLGAVARTVASELVATDPARRVEVVIADGLRAEADPPLVRTLVENLLGNAWKFTKNVLAPRIEFGVTERDGASAFFVRDNGAGFDMTYANKLFAPFQRLHTVAEFPGTGIGLATAQRIVRRHGGRIWAEGCVDGGATFYFTLLTAPGGTA